MTAVAFAEIQALFREKDRDEMLWAFDLWDVEDVRQHSELILQRLESGEMPCDDPWPAQNVALFRDWIAAGTPA
jgi:hypothetical protein